MKNNKGFTISELFFVFLIIILIAAAMTPLIRLNREKRDNALCINNLQQIGLGMFIYAIEHDKQFPNSIKELYEEKYVSDESLLDCPGNKNVGTLDSPDYIYHAGLSANDDSSLVLLEDKSKNHSRQGKNILYANGSVAWIQE